MNKSIKFSFFTLVLLALATHSLYSQEEEYSYTYHNFQDSAIDKVLTDIYGQTLGWTMFKDIMFPGTTIYGAMKRLKNKFPNTSVLSCKIIGGDAYNNIFYTYTFAKKNKHELWDFSTVNQFSYQLKFYVENTINCDTSNRTELEGLEFTFQLAKPPVSYLWGIQWSKSNRWCYWDDTKFQNKPKGWIGIPNLSICIQDKQWNQLHISGHRSTRGLFYDKMILNGQEIPLHIFVPVAYLPADWSDNYLQLGFQINGNKAILKNHLHSVDPVTVYLNQIQLKMK